MGFRSFTLSAFLFFGSFIAFAQSSDVMYAHYIDVGQANAVLLEFSCGAVLIDAGDQDTPTRRHLYSYLDRFFDTRPDLNRTLDLVIITHDHIDHNDALDMVANNFNIKNYIDNGFHGKCKKCSGWKKQDMMQDNVDAWGINYASYSFGEITAGHNTTGLTSEIIDPVNCDGTDPEIILYSGAFKTKPAGWAPSTFAEKGNNHSLFIKVLFGEASFLFIGDGEIAEMKTVVNYYAHTNALDADVLMVGHHGAKNATTHAFLSAVSPRYAIISCGQWNDSMTNGQYNTYHYGHPTDSCLNMLEAHMQSRRDPIIVKAGLWPKIFIDLRVFM